MNRNMGWRPWGRRCANLLDWLEINPDRSAVYTGDLLSKTIRRRRCGDCVIGIEIHTLPPGSDAPSAPCVRCGWCVEQCPMSIHPAQLLEASQQGGQAHGPFGRAGFCIECGICSYICPSQLPLAASIRKLKAM